MLRARELSAFRKTLVSWFRRYQRDLPWRRTKDAYRVWVSEIMLQQTRVAAVVPYYERFLERFPDVQSLADAPEEDVLRLWSGLGYYSRARNLQRGAQQILSRHEGSFPSTFEAALALPGIGAYTAAAILSIAYGAKHAVVDGNVARVIARLFAVKGDLRVNGCWGSLQRIAEELLDSKAPGDWNQAMMELGATVCLPRSPQCLLCPIAQHCRARKLGITESVPAKHKKPATVEVTLAAAVVVDAGERCLLLAPAKSTEGDDEVASLVSRMWHFPMFAVQRDAATELRNLVKAMSPNNRRLRDTRLEPLAKIRHTVTYRSITVLPFRVRVRALPRGESMKAVPLHEVCSPSALAISNLTRKIARVASNSADCSGPEQTPRKQPTPLFADRPLASG